ncbi:hypothetical protein KP509_13G048600 [Ceratopteris richardii]|uniref:WRKY domain-containing protein n=1 Tax=Ceratopteris richardii TaxID=49495 RepID=A0A8T2TDC4_CERRI|nr:hypothetical protein KP509_13G048600 [Ceratopteris richardii]
MDILYEIVNERTGDASNMGNAIEGGIIPGDSPLNFRSSFLNPTSGTTLTGSRSYRYSSRQLNDAEAVRFHIMSSTINVCDGFAWLKYGEKKIKHNLYPRCYFRCAHPNCTVSRQREASSDMQGMVSITYFGKHNHLPPQEQTLNTRRKKREVYITESQS